ncbi:MAG: hypothetical protein ABSF95_22605, partial [Verrucomicrobiota bacterium]
RSRRCNRWREFAFVLRQVLRAVVPWLPLRQMLDEWEQIAADLAEPPRKRKSQEEIFIDAEEGLL